MLSSRFSDRRVQPRKGDSEEEYVSDGEDSSQQLGSEASRIESDSESGQHTSEADSGSNEGNSSLGGESASEASEDENEDIKNISFGALVKAQAAFAPPSKSRKRKLVIVESTTNQQANAPSVDNPHPTHDIISKKPKQDLTNRTSKHAPQVLSSRHPVSRKLDSIMALAPVEKFRDPRFDPAITSRTLNTNSIAAASRAYSFLTDYQATEILTLKSEIKRAQTKDPQQAAELKKKLMSMESRLRNAEVKSKEREILAKHKTQEKQAIKEGRKSQPYFLKKSDVKKEIERERVTGMNKRQKDKMEKRKRMREKRKEAKDMPWARRMG